MYPLSRSTCALLYAIATGITGLSSGAAAQTVVEGSIQYLQASNNKGPWEEPLTEFQSLVKNSPNATGNFPIAGPNISAPYSIATNTDGSSAGFSKIEGWSWSIAVVADLPLTNSSSPSEKNNFYTGGKLAFNAPSSLLSPASQNLSVNDDWNICIFTWEPKDVVYPNKLRSDDGTCTSVLSSQCISDMEKAVKSYGCACPLSRDIPSCAELGNSSKLWDTTCGGRIYNASAIRAWEDGKLDVKLFGGVSTHEHGNNTDYNYIGSVAWPVMTSFASNNSVKAVMSCPRANNAVNGSTAPSGEGFQDAQNGTGQGDAGQGGNKKSSGSRMNGNWLIYGTFVALFMFML